MSGFDCEDHYLEHCYLVQIPKTVNGTVMIFEVFGERVPATVAVLEPRGGAAGGDSEVQVGHDFGRTSRRVQQASQGGTEEIRPLVSWQQRGAAAFRQRVARTRLGGWTRRCRGGEGRRCRPELAGAEA